MVPMTRSQAPQSGLSRAAFVLDLPLQAQRALHLDAVARTVRQA